jgi:RNA polymerase sigma-70 factor (ECF subfamily)
MGIGHVTFARPGRLHVRDAMENDMSAQPARPPSVAGRGERQGSAVIAPWRFRLAVLLHDRAVFRVAAALLRDSREAEDITQEVFLLYWQRGAEVERPREWLMRVTRNACLDRLRRSGRLVSSEHPEEPEASEDRDPAWHYEQEELGEKLRALVATLPEPQRSLIVLFDMQGLDGATCARILELNVNQVKVYLHRARRRLREQLERSP